MLMQALQIRRGEWIPGVLILIIMTAMVNWIAAPAMGTTARRWASHSPQTHRRWVGTSP